jgi:arginase
MPTQSLSRLGVVGVRYSGSSLAKGDECALDAYAASGVYEQAQVPVDIIEPRFPEGQHSKVDADNVGLLCGSIADAVAAARREGKAVLVTGGDCSHAPGILGGLQDAHGPSARIGLVWFDAHGDFNTPQTTPSGNLSGMPVAVCAGLAHSRWRELAHVVVPLPTDRIVMMDARNLDPLEERLIRATGVVIATPPPDRALWQSVADLAARCDALYLHVDVDILDESLVPNNDTGEPNGLSIGQALAATDTVLATGKVAVLAMTSACGEGEGSEVTVASAIALIRGGLKSWRRHGVSQLATSLPDSLRDAN